MLITSITLNYHPDDVELWLVDYNKVEFAEYISNMPPHVKLIGLERGTEFTFSLLEKVNEECQRRMEMFKRVGVSDITEYKRKFGVRSLPRIILIIDEFHQMTHESSEELPFSSYNGTDYFVIDTNSCACADMEDEYRQLYLDIRKIAFKETVSLEEKRIVVRYVRILKSVEYEHLVPFLYELGAAFFRWAKGILASTV